MIRAPVFGEDYAPPSATGSQWAQLSVIPAPDYDNFICCGAHVELINGGT
jgi:hypothetical protein